MSGTPPSGLESLLGGRGNSPSGMEVAHFIGQTYWLQRLKDFLSLGRHDPQNLRALPNRDRGALVFNETKHARHVDEINKIVFDNRSIRKFQNVSEKSAKMQRKALIS